MTTSQPSTKQRWAGGLSIVAGCVLLVVGILEFLQGVSAVAADNVFVVGTNYIYKFNLTTWGWIHLIVGVLAIIIAGGLAVAATWARAAGSGRNSSSGMAFGTNRASPSGNPAAWCWRAASREQVVQVHAAALAAILLGAVLVLYWIYDRLVGIDNLKLG